MKREPIPCETAPLNCTNLHGWVFGIWCYSCCQFNGCDTKTPNVCLVVITMYLKNITQECKAQKMFVFNIYHPSLFF